MVLVTYSQRRALFKRSQALAAQWNAEATNEAYIPSFAKGQTTIMHHTPIDMNPIVVQLDRWPEVVIGRLDAAVAEARP